MYFTDDSLLPENQDPLIITAEPYGPIWMPADYPEDIPVTWHAQVQKAVDCYNRSHRERLRNARKLECWNNGVLES
jgi:hypothetical protein